MAPTASSTPLNSVQFFNFVKYSKQLFSYILSTIGKASKHKIAAIAPVATAEYIENMKQPELMATVNNVLITVNLSLC